MQAGAFGIYKMVSLYPTLCPVTAVKITIPDSFGNMHGLYLLRAGQIGNGAGDFEDAAVGAGGELQALHSHA